MTVTLRLAESDDAPAIAALHADSWRFAYRGAYSDEYLDGPVYADRSRVWQERLSAPPPNQHVILAEDGGALIGFACAYGDDDAHWGTLLDNLHVKPALHRHGLGRQLVGAVARWTAETYPGRGLYLWVLEPNDRARRFYESLGGTDIETRESEPPGGGLVTAHRIVWPATELPAHKLI